MKFWLTFLLFLLQTSLISLAQQRIYLDELDLSRSPSGWKVPQMRKAVDYDTIRIHGKSYKRGVGTHATAKMEIWLDGQVNRFHAEVGIDDKVAQAVKKTPGSGVVAFTVLADGQIAYYSDTVKANEPAKKIDINLKGVSRLILYADQLGPSHHDHVDFADAYFEYEGSPPFGAPEVNEIGEILTQKTPDRPLYNGALRYGASPNKPILIKLAVSGKEPLKIKPINLPKGIKYDASNKCLRGSISKKGTYKLTFEAINKSGKEQILFDIVVGDTLQLTPPMGWNSWNCWGMEVSAKSIKQSAEAFKKFGLDKFGWQYINIDDGWQGERTPDGTITTNAKFPNIKKLADSLHSLGYKIGIYSSPGEKTCGGLPGSFNYEEKDANTYANWGIDYLKYDWCSYESKVNRFSPVEQHIAAYQKISKPLKATDRDIVLSLCQYGYQKVETWGQSAGGSLWRTTGDIIDTWESMTQIIDLQYQTYPYAKAGSYNDPDMLVIGQLGWSSKIRNTRLLPSEQYYHITMWSMLAAPLLLGCDLTKLDEFTLNLITNREVIAINQDILCKQAVRIYQDTAKFPFAQKNFIEVWRKPLANGEYAIAICNRGYDSGYYTLTPQKLGLKSIKKIRDCWRQKDLKLNGNEMDLIVSRHGVVLLRVRE